MVDDVYSKPMAYEEEVDGETKVVYRASSFGSCVGALVRARLGVTPSPPSDMMLERFQEGHDWEARVLEKGLGKDWVLIQNPDHLALFGTVVKDVSGNLQVETKIAWGNKVVRCHPDGIAVHRETGEKRVVEVKFLGESMVRQIAGALNARYSWQADIEMLSTGLPLLYIIGEKKIEGEGELRRVVGIGDVSVMEHAGPSRKLVDVKMRVAEVEGWVTRGEMPACPVPLDYPCDYWREHEEVEKEEITDGLLELLVESYERAMSKMEASKASADSIKAEITERLGELKVEGGRCQGWEIVRVAPEKGNVSWSSAYKALSKMTGERVDEDEYRGKVPEGYTRMSKVKE